MYGSRRALADEVLKDAALSFSNTFILVEELEAKSIAEANQRWYNYVNTFKVFATAISVHADIANVDQATAKDIITDLGIHRVAPAGPAISDLINFEPKDAMQIYEII